MHKLLHFFHFPNPGLATKSSLNLLRFGRFVTYHWKVTCTSGGVWETQGGFQNFCGKLTCFEKTKTAPSPVFDRKKGIATVFFFCCHDSQGYEGGERRDVNRAVKKNGFGWFECEGDDIFNDISYSILFPQKMNMMKLQHPGAKPPTGDELSM